MKEFVEKLLNELNYQKEYNQIVYDAKPRTEHEKDLNAVLQSTYDSAIRIVKRLAGEYKGGWITDRNPTREECGEYGHAEFQVTIPQSKGNKTITMDFAYETVRGKEVARWKWCDRLSPWKVLAWKPLDAPYQPKGE